MIISIMIIWLNSSGERCNINIITVTRFVKRYLSTQNYPIFQSLKFITYLPINVFVFEISIKVAKLFNNTLRNLIIVMSQMLCHFIHQYVNRTLGHNMVSLICMGFNSTQIKSLLTTGLV